MKVRREENPCLTLFSGGANGVNRRAILVGVALQRDDDKTKITAGDSRNEPITTELKHSWHNAVLHQLDDAKHHKPNTPRTAATPTHPPVPKETMGKNRKSKPHQSRILTISTVIIHTGILKIYEHKWC